MLEMPRFIEEEYHYYDDEGIHLKDDAPEWAKEEYQEYLKNINPTADENGKIVEY